MTAAAAVGRFTNFLARLGLPPVYCALLFLGGVAAGLWLVGSAFPRDRLTFSPGGFVHRRKGTTLAVKWNEVEALAAGSSVEIWLTGDRFVEIRNTYKGNTRDLAEIFAAKLRVAGVSFDYDGYEYGYG